MQRVLFLIPSLQTRGAERVLVNLANALDKTRYNVTVQTLFDVGGLRHELGEEVEYRPGLPWLVRGNVHLLKLLSPRQAYRCIVRKRYDVVVAFLEGAVTRIVSGCPFADSKLVAWVHGQQVSRQTIAYCYRSEREMAACLQKFHRVECVAASLRDELLSLVPEIPAERVGVMRNAIDANRIRQRAALPLATDGMTAAAVKVVTLGSLVKVKGYERLIAAHKRLLERGLIHYIYIIGGGPELKALQQLSITLGVDKTVCFMGEQPNPYPYLAKADLYVCSSYQEGISTAVAEALILGVPVVSTDCSGARELLGDDNEYGIVTDNNTEALAAGMARMLSDKNTMNHYRQKSAERGRFFEMQKAVDAVEVMIDNL